MIDSYSIKKDFPIFNATGGRGRDLIYLDSAASAQKPLTVIEAISAYYSGYYSNTGRGLYWPATAASKALQAAREKVAGFIGADSPEVIFTGGTTSGINSLANSLLFSSLTEGDEIVVSVLEHHSNFLPWKQWCQDRGARLRVVPLTEDHTLDVEAFGELVGEKTKLVALSAVSNVTGAVQEIRKLADIAHAKGVPVLIDAAQWVAHGPVDVREIDCDFMAFSGHKLYGPTGIGVLYIRSDHHKKLRPFHFGGGMVMEVSEESMTFKDSPGKFEGGTGNIAGAIGLAAAVEYLSEIGMEKVHPYLSSLTRYLKQGLQGMEGVDLVGDTDNQGPVVSFLTEGIHPHDMAGFLGEKGIAIRAGHHCAQPLMSSLNLTGTCRASLGIYNHEEDIDKLLDGIREARDFFI